MSEGDVSLIRDEDVLRRMWQQTEDFSRKKEIRAHMYRLREERLRNLYSPEPPAPAHSPGKGVEQTHVAALADQSFQRLKRKEVRDAGSPSPPRDLSRGALPAELRELSNAGWNVESENRTTDDGHTQVRAVTANIEGRYDVEGGRGQFTALDQQRRARTEYHDDHSSLQRDESASNTAHREQVVRKTDDGMEFTSTATSSNSTSKVEQYSSTHEVPYVTNDDYDLAQDNTNRKEYTKVTKTNDYEQNLRRNEYESGELVSRKVDYPDDNTKVIVETRCLPDGTRVTSTRREFRAPVQSTRSEQHSAKSESKSYSTSSHHKSDIRESTKNIREFDTRTHDIVDSQKYADDYDFKRNESDYLTQKDNYSVIQQKNQQTSNNKRFDTKESSTKVIRETVDSRSDIVDTQSNVDDYEIKRNHRPDHLVKKDDVTTSELKNTRHETKTNESDRYETTTDIKINKNSDYSTHKDDISTQRVNRHEIKVDETDRREFTTFVDSQNVPRDVKEVRNVRDSEERVHSVTRDKKVEDVVEKKMTSDQYQTTYQTDFTQKKISTDWSPTHQAWASTLRADTPSSTRPTTRASSPGSKTYQSSTSSLRSSVSPDKTTRKPTSRGGSPSKVDRYSPSRSSTERYSSTHSTHSVTETKTDRFTSPDRKPPSSRFATSPEKKVDGFHQRPSQSPEKRPLNSHRSSPSPERKPGYKSSPSEEYPRTYSPSSPKAGSPSRSSVSPQRKPGYQPSNGKSTPDSGYPRTTSPYRSTISPEKKVPGHPKDISSSRPSMSPDRKPGHQQPSPTRTSPEKKHPFNESPKRPSVSPDRTPGYMRSTGSSIPFERPSSDWKSPAKNVPSQSPEQKPYTKITKAKEDHYKFIDEETKMYTRIDQDVNVTEKTTSPSPDRYSTPHDKSPLSTRNSPEDTTDNRCESPSILRKGNRSPSPPKGPVTFTRDRVDKSKSTVTDVTTKYDYQNVEIDSSDVKYDTLKRQNKTTTKEFDVPASPTKKSPRDSISPTKYPDSPREPSPSKFGTYDKNRQTDEVKNIRITTKDSSDVKYDTLTRQNKTTTKESDIPGSPTKKSPRDSGSPTKYPDSHRESSPSKFGTYDKKRQTDEIENITVTTTKSNDVKNDSLTRQNKTITKESDIPALPTKRSPRDTVSPTKYPDSPREPSPSKFGTYDKKRQTDEVKNITVTTEDSSEELEKGSTTTVEDRTDVKFDSLTRRHKTDSSRPDLPSSPVKKAPRDSVSPTKTSNIPKEPSPSKYGTYDKKQYQTDELEEVITTTKKDTTDVKYDSFKRQQQLNRPRQEPDIASSPTKKSPRDSVSPTKTPIREPSPSKYGANDKKQYHTEELKEVTTTSTTEDTTDIKYDSLTRRQKTSSTKPDLPSSPTKKSPRESASPVKSPTKDAKYKHTTDFIATETMTEEINKKATKDRPRQLVTPSTSPTRKPKPSDTAPSTGQSSPTTSVSGFVYFGSPQTNRNIVTDLDDYEYHTETNTTTTSNIRHTRPETLNVKRSPSPPKIPCKLQTTEKKVSPAKEILPRKSSLKKPPTDFNLTSPVEKPPSSFRVSPTDDGKQFPEHKIVKKDHADKPMDSPIKQKPPFERRETYEERCLKILGVIDDDTKQVTKTDKEPNSNLSSPSVSPCPSPELKEQLPFKNVDTQETTKVKVTDFITREQEDTVKKTTTRREDIVTADRKTTKPTRESSPTKLRDIITTSKYDKTTTEAMQEDNIPKTVRQSPDRDIGYRKPRGDKRSPDLKSPRSSPIRSSLSPEKSPELPEEGTTSEYPRTKSPSKPYAKEVRSSLSPERKSGYQQPTSPSKSIPEKGSTEKHPKQSVPTRTSVSPDRKPDYIKTTASTTTQRKETSTVEDIHKETTSTTVKQSLDRETGYQKPKDRKPDTTRSTSPDKTRKGKSSDRKPGYEVPTPILDKNVPESKPTDKPSSRPSASPDKKPGYMKPTAATVTKFEETTIEDFRDVMTSKIVEKTHPTSPQQSSSKKPEEPKHSRTSSPTKTVKKVTQDISEFIQFEREQEVLDRVQQSLRKLSPNREQRSPSREKSPGKTTISLQDIDVVTNQRIDEDDVEITEKQTTTRTDVTRIEKPKEQKPTTTTVSRTVSPTKKPASTIPSKVDKSPESPNKSRSISPKKPISPTERPRSPQVPKASGIKPREPIPSNLTRKSTSTSPTKTEKISTEVKKTTGVTKQNSFTKTSTVKTTASKVISSPNKTEPETKRALTPKGINKENVSPKKEDTKVTRTPSDISLKIKKPSPQRMRSKPEIQVNDVTTTKTTKTTTNTTRKATKEPQTKLAPKPKSATALNTSTDEDDIIIDVELAKSSRENSPDRICPTPVNFSEDVGTPRFPDEVSEPDDDFRNRTHHTIHETESIVDDIVEICEDDELFVKRPDVDRITESDECLLSVTDKVSKFTHKIENVNKPKESTMQFKDTEKRVHSDFIKEDLKSDECLLTVSEKVNKFAKGPRDTKDKSPSRRITDEYDTETVYQDDYTKLSVNDKAHLFVETAENVKTPKNKPTQPIERPDLSNIDESLKSDDCLLSVSDKVNKFVKTTEHFLTESQEVDEKEKKVREEYEKFIKHIVEDSEEDAYESKKIAITKEVSDRKLTDEKKPSFAKETSTSHAKVKDYSSPNLKPTERIPTVKITTLRSSEAVKKAKALFENIASTTQKTKDTKTTTLMDIGVIKKSPKTDSTTVLHPSVEDSLNVTETDSEVDAPYTPTASDRPSSGTLTRPRQPAYSEDKPRSPIRLSTQSPEVPRNKSPHMWHTAETTAPKKTVLSRYPAAQTEPKKARPDINKERPQDKAPKQPSTNDTKQLQPESEKPQEKIPSYQRPTKTSQIKEEKTIEEAEVSSRRGSGKFGVELRRTSVERSTVSSERRRSSDHHQPCIEDIFDLDLLEQMLEKVVGYEQRRRIRSQIRVAKKRMETEHYESNNYLKTTKPTNKSRSPEPRHFHKYPDTQKPPTNPHEGHSRFTPQKSTPSVHTQPKEQSKPLLNGHAKEPSNLSEKRQRPQSPEKPKSVPKTRSPVRRPSPEKNTRTTSPTKTTPKPKSNRFSEYATAYMKKVGLEADKLKVSDKTRKGADDVDHKTDHTTTKKTTDIDDNITVNRFETITETKSSSMSKSFSERTSSKDTIEIVQLNGKRSPSPEKRSSPERRRQSPGERLHQRTPSPDFKRSRTDKETIVKTVYETNQPGTVKETIIKTVYEERPRVETTRKETTIKTAYALETKIQPKTAYVLEKKVHPKTVPEDKPSWVTNRNLKKPNEPRTFPTKRAEDRARPARPGSPARALVRPTDVITSSYGPGPLDADGRPLFGIKALRNGASNYQVKGTVVRQEFHSRNGGEPEGSVSVTAYSTEPRDLEKLLQTQGERPSRIHGLAAITTTKRFGGDSGASIRDAQTKEERAALEQFTHSDRRVEDSTLQVTDVTDVDDAMVDRRDVKTIEDRSMRTDDRSVRTDDRSVRTEVKANERGVRTEDRQERADRREDKKTVRQSSVKSLTEKYIKSASDTLKSERCVYPKAGLILRTANMRDSVSSDSSAHAGLARTDSEQSLGSVEEHAAVTTRVVDGHRATATATTTRHAPDSRRTTVTTTRHAPDSHRTTTVTTTRHAPETRRTVTTRNAPDGQRTVTTRTTATTERSFLDSSSKVTGVQDILTRMKNADIVIQEGDTSEDAEARALLNKFLGATVLMAGMQGYVADQPGGGGGLVLKQQETVRSSGVTSARAEQIDPEHCWDERELRKLLDECTDYEQRRRLRARLRTLMAEQEACASAVTEALAAAGEAPEPAEAAEAADAREEEEVTVSSSVRRNSSEKTVSSSTITRTSKVIESAARPAPKPVSPFAKFRQLEKQNSTNSPNSPKTPQSPGSQAPYFKFTDPALQASALTIKERLLQWCRDKTRDYENVKLENFSTSWADGLAFCALLHHFLPDAFDYSQLTADKRRHNFTLAFKIADEKAGIYPLLDVDDMVTMRKPDWKCVFTYVQAIHRRFKDQS